MLFNILKLLILLVVNFILGGQTISVCQNSSDPVCRAIKDKSLSYNKNLPNVTGLFGTLQKKIQELEVNSIHCVLSYLVYKFFSEENPNINYHLYTRDTREKSCDLQPTSKALKKCHFNPKLPTFVLITGFAPLPPDRFDLKETYGLILGAGNYNVIVHNWTAYNVSYYNAGLGNILSTGWSIYAGLKMSAWIRYLQIHAGAEPKNFHLLGHGAGAEVASYAGKTTCYLGNITFFDPGPPLYRILPSFLLPSSTDALYTQAAHSSAGAFSWNGEGYIDPIADIDYYMNDGKDQPACLLDLNDLIIKKGNQFQRYRQTRTYKQRVLCNHYILMNYYFWSFFPPSYRFFGLICGNYQDYKSGKCSPENSTRCEMGFYSQRIPGLPVHSKCYIGVSRLPLYSLENPTNKRLEKCYYNDTSTATKPNC